MAKNNEPASFIDTLKNEQVSLVTGTLAIATAFLVALSVMPTPENQSTSLLQASVFNLASL